MNTLCWLPLLSSSPTSSSSPAHSPSVRQPPAEPDPKDLRAQQREDARERYVDWYNSLLPGRRKQVDKKVANRHVEKWRKQGLL